MVLEYLYNYKLSVVATAGGKIEYKYQAKGAGHYLVVTHNSKYRTRYLHLNGNTLTKSGEVKEGEVIGNISNSGTEDVHLHYEIEEYVDGKWKPISPYDEDGKLIDVQVLVNHSNGTAKEIAKYGSPMQFGVSSTTDVTKQIPIVNINKSNNFMPDISSFFSGINVGGGATTTSFSPTESHVNPRFLR